ncbi:MAG: DUF4845 domain-containing protein [Rhodocyclaceae bacterium]|nr:DUF4845 domain-containing protein [Rhodocyclaceae bacterium]MBR4877569.1 DUF4845 domain-containing protein [Rhodocyclaceae bacterium]
MNLKSKQRGLSGVEMLAFAILAAIALLITFKALPAITEAKTVQNIINEIGSEGQRNASMTRGQLAESFRKRALINDVISIKGDDLKIERKNGKLTIQAAWERKVPLYNNVGLYFEYDLKNQ